MDRARERGVDTVIMIPDEYLAKNVAKQTRVKIIAWKGHCEVHERFTAENIRDYRAANPGVVVLAHPECAPDVVAEADFAGSTSAMIGYVGEKAPRARGAGHRMLDERQRRGRIPRRRIRAAVQSVPAHEAHHAGENFARAGNDDRGSHGRSVDRGARAQAIEAMLAVPRAMKKQAA